MTLKDIWQKMLEWHCIMESHLWFKRYANYKQCVRCNKRRML